MKTFACGAVVPGCTATFRSDSETSILQQVTAHARHHHGLTDIPAELVEQVCSHIRTVAA